MGKNNYLSEPRRIGIGIDVPKTGIKVKDVPEIVRSEDFFEEIRMYGMYDKEENYNFCRPSLEQFFVTDKVTGKNITMKEVFSRLETLENMEISSKKIGWGRIEDALCEAVDAEQSFLYPNFFYLLKMSLRGREDAKIAWKKEGNQFSLTIWWGAVIQKTFTAESLFKCFEDADKFLYPN